ncbi:MAG: AP-2 family transcription factor, partial [Magnetospirillum sp.]|nr:AP-2 family transcription factor [Magnetospirillum sp.]
GAGHFRLLFESDPAAFAVALASALNNLSNRLSDLGRDDEARQAGDEAFDLARRAIPANPDQARFVLVSTLMNQSGRSWRAGQSLRAIEEMGTAVETFREGGEALFSFLGVMVDALHRNAMALSEAARWEEAMAVRRMTAQLFPADRIPAPVNHLLALTLQQAAFAASRDGRPGEALSLVEEAVDLARGLAEVAPEQYRLFLAQSLANQASRQHEAHADPEALDSALEAVNAFQEVAKVDAPSAIVPLAATLETFAAILTSLGHDAQASNVLAQREQLMSAMTPVEE